MSSRFQDQDDVSEDVAIVLSKTRGRPLALSRSMLGRLNGDQVDLLAEMQARALAVVELEEWLTEFTRIGREMGISWHALGFAQGLTGDGLRRRMTDPEA